MNAGPVEFLDQVNVYERHSSWKSNDARRFLLDFARDMRSGLRLRVIFCLQICVRFVLSSPITKRLVDLVVRKKFFLAFKVDEKNDSYTHSSLKKFRD